MRPRQGRRGRRLALLAGAAAALMWCGGLIHFVVNLPRAEAEPDRAADGIIVLTGSSDRLYAGLDLLREGRAKRALISGVDRVNDRAALRRALKRGLAQFDCCTDLGWEARDTTGNAHEAADWARENGYHSLRVVTAQEHMPRSLLEMRRVMPDIELIPHPVITDGAPADGWPERAARAGRLIREYVKYLFSLVRARLLDGTGRGA